MTRDFTGGDHRGGEMSEEQHSLTVKLEVETLRRRLVDEQLRHDTLRQLSDIGESRVKALTQTDKRANAHAADDAVLRRVIEALHRYSAVENDHLVQEDARAGGGGGRRRRSRSSSSEESLDAESDALQAGSAIPLGASATHRTKGVCRVVFRGQTILGPGLW